MFIYLIWNMNRRVSESEQDVIRSGIDFIVRHRMCRSWYIDYNYWILCGETHLPQNKIEGKDIIQLQKVVIFE